ncbi:hypothetical protein HOD08_03235 [bacterium]|jgi:hypothetical protein|nr:hypothetical protein [bacterium]
MLYIVAIVAGAIVGVAYAILFLLHARQRIAARNEGKPISTKNIILSSFVRQVFLFGTLAALVWLIKLPVLPVFIGFFPAFWIVSIKMGGSSGI